MQSAIYAAIASDDDMPATSVGMTIYRNAYRARLLGALKESFERTRQWAGDQAFNAAACHYILKEPPRDWTLDTFGASFPDCLSDLFPEDPELPELAWLEWSMQRAFAAVDGPALSAEALAAAGFEEGDWDHVSFSLRPGTVWRRIETNCADIWLALQNDQALPVVAPCEEGAGLLVWRRGFSPQFRLINRVEVRAIGQVADGATLGEIMSEVLPEQGGLMLATWLSDGLLAEARRNS